MNYLSNNLRYLRIKNRYKLKDMANVLNQKSHALYSYYESGRNEPSVKSLIKLSEFFNVSISDLIQKDLSK